MDELTPENIEILAADLEVHADKASVTEAIVSKALADLTVGNRDALIGAVVARTAALQREIGIGAHDHLLTLETEAALTNIFK